MATCPDCGNDHGPLGERTPAQVGWADQFRAEFRDSARALYAEAVASQLGRPVAFDESVWAKVDPFFQIGGDAMLVVLMEHGALKKAAR